MGAIIFPPVLFMEGYFLNKPKSQWLNTEVIACSWKHLMAVFGGHLPCSDSETRTPFLLWLPHPRGANFSVCTETGREEDAGYVGDGQAWKQATSLVLTSHWLEATHKATPYCKGGWEM